MGTLGKNRDFLRVGYLVFRGVWGKIVVMWILIDFVNKRKLWRSFWDKSFTSTFIIFSPFNLITFAFPACYATISSRLCLNRTHVPNSVSIFVTSIFPFSHQSIFSLNCFTCQIIKILILPLSFSTGWKEKIQKNLMLFSTLFFKVLGNWHKNSA